MKFNKFRNSSLTEVFTKQDWDYFNAAYSIGIKEGTHDLPAEKAKRGRARAWIIDVLEIFAAKLDLELSQAKQLFENGDLAAVRDIYARKLPGIEDRLSKMPAMRDDEGKPTSLAYIGVENKRKEMVKLSEMDSQDIINAVRAEWTRALSIQHPLFDRHAVSGKSYIRQGEASKVQGKRGESPIVASKRPKAAKAAA